MLNTNVYKDESGIYVPDLDKYSYTKRQRKIIESKVSEILVKRYRVQLLREDGEVAQAQIPHPKELNMGITTVRVQL